MPYTKPDVSVFIDLNAQSFDVPTPDLWPCYVGEHYHVIDDSFGGVSKANESQTFEYPFLPDSYNDSDKKLIVDTESDFSPAVEMVLDQTGERVDITDWVSFSDTDFTVPIINETKNGVPYNGAIYVSYRALSDKYSGVNTDLLKAQSTEKLKELFGEAGVGPANPLGFAMFQGLQHANIGVSAVAVGSTPAGDGSGTYNGQNYDTMLAYQYAYDFLKGENVYAIVPLTQNDYVLDVTTSHVEYMSGPQGKNERHAFFSPELSDYWPVRRESEGVDAWFNVTGSTVTEQTVLNDGTDPASEETDIGHSFKVGDYQILRISAGDGSGVGTFLINGLTPQNLLDGDVTVNGETLTIEVTENLDSDDNNSSGDADIVYLDLGESLFRPANQRVRLSDVLQMEGYDKHGYVQEVGVADINSLVKIASKDGDSTNFTGSTFIDPFAVGDKRIAFLREKTGFEIVEGIRDFARSYQDNRLTLVGPDWFAASVDGDATDVKGFYAASQIAAEVCLVGRQQAGAVPGSNGMTGLRNSVEKVWKSSRYFNDQQLDTAAGGGFTWFVNDQKGAPVRTRHLLTTDMSSIEARETILSVERDFAARTFRRSFRPDIHRYRIDDSLIQKLNLKGNSIAETLTNPTSNSRCFRSITITNIAQDEIEPDTVNITFEMTHLYPLNNIVVTMSIVV